MVDVRSVSGSSVAGSYHSRMPQSDAGQSDRTDRTYRPERDRRYSNAPQSYAGSSVPTARPYNRESVRRTRRETPAEAAIRRGYEDLEAAENRQLDLEAARMKDRNRNRNTGFSSSSRGESAQEAYDRQRQLDYETEQEERKTEERARQRETVRDRHRDRNTGIGSSLVPTNYRNTGVSAYSDRDYTPPTAEQAAYEQRMNMIDGMRDSLRPLMEAPRPYIDPSDSIVAEGALVIARERFIHGVLQQVGASTYGQQTHLDSISQPLPSNLMPRRDQRCIDAPSSSGFVEEEVYERPYVTTRERTYRPPPPSYPEPENRRRSTRDSRDDRNDDYDRY
jgi:hypothetical protein